MPTDRRLLLVIADAIAATFSESDWKRLGFLTDTYDRIINHHRLLRSLDFNDPDYEGHVLDMVATLDGRLGGNFSPLHEFPRLVEWIQVNRPESLGYLPFDALPRATPASGRAPTLPTAANGGALYGRFTDTPDGLPDVVRRVEPTLPRPPSSSETALFPPQASPLDLAPQPSPGIPAVTFPFDVAVSFAGEDRAYANQIVQQLQALPVRVFQDSLHQAELWGSDLPAHLHDIFAKKARYCIVLVSAQYAAKAWPRHELRAAIARELQQNSPYLLPVKLDDTELPGVAPTKGYLPAGQYTPGQIAQLFYQKLRSTSS